MMQDRRTNLSPLLRPLRVGAMTLRNRVLMAPLTRCRATREGVPTALMGTYYAQRARGDDGAGLIISEATTINPRAGGYPFTPGIYTEAHVEGWRGVTRAVREAGGRIVCQLWHVGRVSHPDFQPGGEAPVSSSALTAGGECRTYEGKKPRVPARALREEEILATIADYAHAARCAVRAGFDGVEVHGANTYLPEQFLRSGMNRRTDGWGGSLENRARFLLEATRACVEAIGGERVGVRLSPSSSSELTRDENPRETYAYVARRLSELGVAYQHIMLAVPGWGALEQPMGMDFFRPLVKGVLITNGGLTLESGEALVGSGVCDAVAYGTLFISNPDLAGRLRRLGVRAPLNAADPSTYYTPGERGYTDYPALEG